MAFNTPWTNFSSNANSEMDFVDDLLWVNGNAQGPWQVFTTNGGTWDINQATAAHPGVWVLGTGTSAANGMSEMDFENPSGSLAANMAVGAGVFTLTWYFNIPTLSTAGQRYSILMGLTGTNNTTTPADGIYLTYSDNANSGDWVMHTSKSSTATNTNSSVTVATGWQVVQMVVNAAATSVSFRAGTTLANLSSLGSITTHIPTAVVSPNCFILNSVGTAGSSLYVDLVTVNIALTTAR
jgi:hypothetical protein